MDINKPPGHHPKILLHTISPLDSSQPMSLPYSERDLRDAYSELTCCLNARGICAIHALILMAHEIQQAGWTHQTSPVDPEAD